MTIEALSSPHPNHQPLRGLLFCLVGLLAVSFSISLRIEPSVMQTDIMQLFHIAPTVFDELMVRYQYSLIATLLFAGVVVDYVGAQAILCVAVFIAVIGNTLFSEATTVSMLLNGRIVLGYAHPFILISAIKLGATWLPRRYFSFYVGLLFATLLMTPVLLKPYFMATVMHWGMAAFSEGLNGIGLVLVIALLVLRKQTIPSEPAVAITRHDVMAVLTNHNIAKICLISCFGWMANTFLLNYGALFLIKNYHFHYRLAAETINTAFLYFAVGAVVLSLLAELLHRKHVLILIGYLLAAGLFSMVLYLPSLGLLSTAFLLFGATFCAGTAVICYAIARHFCTTTTAGTTFGMIAFVTTLGNVLFTLLVGHLLEAGQQVQATVHFSAAVLTPLIPCSLLLGALFTARLHKNVP